MSSLFVKVAICAAAYDRAMVVNSTPSIDDTLPILGVARAGGVHRQVGPQRQRLVASPSQIILVRSIAGAAEADKLGGLVFIRLRYVEIDRIGDTDRVDRTRHAACRPSHRQPLRDIG